MKNVKEAVYNKIVDMGTWELASVADCGSPDSRDSRGAVWLDDVRNALLEKIKDNDLDSIDSDTFAAIADALVPIFTHPKWEIFVDLQAYNEDVTEFGDLRGFDKDSDVALFMIAERLLSGIWDEVSEEETEELKEV